MSLFGNTSKADLILGKKSLKPSTSAKCKKWSIVFLVHYPAPWSSWSSWSILIPHNRLFAILGYTKWITSDQDGPGVDQGHQQDLGAGWWTSGVQGHHEPGKNIFLMSTAFGQTFSWRCIKKILVSRSTMSLPNSNQSKRL